MIRSLLFVSTLLSTAAFAQEQTRFGVGTQVGIHAGVPVVGAEVIMPVHEQLQISYAFVQGETSLASELNSAVVPYISEADFSVAEGSVSLRWFTTRTFYVGAGAGYRMLDLDVKGTDWVERTNFDGTFKSQALQAKAMIGNSWSFANGLYLAVDWVGVGAPILVTESSLSATETAFDSSQRLYRSEENDPEYKRAADKVSGTTMATLLTLRLGFNF